MLTERDLVRRFMKLLGELQIRRLCLTNSPILSDELADFVRLEAARRGNNGCVVPPFRYLLFLRRN